MKYFIAKGPSIQPTLDPIISDKDFEVTKELALHWYTLHAGEGNLNLKAIPNFNKGTEILIRRGTVRLWGEDVSGSECFRRRLEGTLHADIVDTDVGKEVERHG